MEGGGWEGGVERVGNVGGGVWRVGECGMWNLKGGGGEEEVWSVEGGGSGVWGMYIQYKPH